MGVIAVKACSDATVHLEFAKAAFNEITLAIEFLVVPVLVLTCPFGWNDHLHLLESDERSDLVGIVAFVGNDRLGRLALQ